MQRLSRNLINNSFCCSYAPRPANFEHGTNHIPYTENSNMRSHVGFHVESHVRKWDSKRRRILYVIRRGIDVRTHVRSYIGSRVGIFSIVQSALNVTHFSELSKVFKCFSQFKCSYAVLHFSRWQKCSYAIMFFNIF